MSRSVVLAFLGLSTIWGSTWLFIKIGLADWPPVLFAGTRMLLAALLVLLYLRATRRRLPRSWTQWWPAATYGVLEALGFLFVFWGEFYIPSGIAAVIVSLNPLMVVLLSVPVLRERLTLHRIGAALLGLVGVLLTTTNVHSPGFVGSTTDRYMGITLLVLTALCYAVNDVVAKRYVTEQPPMVTSFIQLLVSSALLLSLAAFWEPVATPLRFTPQSILSLFYLALVGSAIAFGLYFYCLKRMGAAELSLLTVISPIVAIALGALVLGEAVGWHLVFGAAAVLGAILWMSLPRFTARAGRVRPAAPSPRR